MTFDDLPLNDAIFDVYRTIANPRSDEWMRPPGCEELYRCVRNHLPINIHYDLESVLRAWGAFGKSVFVGGEIKKSELIVIVARQHGRTCFYRGRGRGECSNEVALDRILPGSKGGTYTLENCMIACSFHNQQRQDSLIEEYLRFGEKACRMSPLPSDSDIA